jgi:hypothetical protein
MVCKKRILVIAITYGRSGRAILLFVDRTAYAVADVPPTPQPRSTRGCFAKAIASIAIANIEPMTAFALSHLSSSRGS